MRLVIFGPQGAGKGTQASLLALYFGIPHISTGDIFRANIKADTPLGAQAAKALQAGELVPDSITQAMLAGRLNKPDTRLGFIIDGFPRTIHQADWLKALLATTEQTIEAVILLDAPHEILVQRALNRGRGDDTTEVINRRLTIYSEQTKPLLDYYGALVLRVDGNRPIDVVQQEIVDELTSMTGVV